MIKDNIVFFKKELINSFEISEIDFDFQDYIGFDYEKHDDYKDVSKAKQGYDIGFPIEIDKLIKKLEELKSKGATHAGLEYHIDHIGYIIEGWSISMATKEDIEKIERQNKQKKKAKIDEEKRKLKKRLEELGGLED